MWIHIPLGFGKTFADPRVNWCYETEPDPGAGGRKIFWPRGKVLGGSSSINGMVYIRGQHEDFDHWRQLGNPGWSASDVLPYFRRAEHQTRGEDEFHATGGPLCVSDVKDGHPLCEAFIKACNEAGYRAQRRLQRREQEGVGYHQTTTRNGKRCSTAVGYLHPVRNRANLQVITGAHTAKSAVRRQARGRRGVPPGWREPLGAGAQGSDPVRRRDRLAADADAVGRRTCRRIWRSSAFRWCIICRASGRACRIIIRRRSN